MIYYDNRLLNTISCDNLFFFKVSKYFSEVFKKLVPSGHAQLVMRTADGDEGDDGTAEPSDSDRFIGVGEEIDLYVYNSNILCNIIKKIYLKI